MSNVIDDMANLRAELHEMKSKYTMDDLTKQEYLQLAYEAVELHLKFLKLAENAPEKKRLTAKTNSILDEAEKVKKAETWSLDTGMLINFDDDPASDHVPQPKPPTASPELANPQSNSSSLLVEPSPTPKQHANPSNKSFGASLRLLAPGVAPSSSRQLPLNEQKLLWQNSALHGCKFPPWQSDPKEAEFEMARGEQPFMYVCSVQSDQ